MSRNENALNVFQRMRFGKKKGWGNLENENWLLSWLDSGVTEGPSGSLS